MINIELLVSVTLVFIVLAFGVWGYKESMEENVQDEAQQQIERNHGL